jgi:hypothetical protein
VRKTEIRVERPEAFFERGRRTAGAADRGGQISPSRVVAFEDVNSFLRVVTEMRAVVARDIRLTAEL